MRDHNEQPVPPIHAQWKKGISGNPRGRPRKSESLPSVLKQELNKVCPLDREGRTWRELVVLIMIQQALKGNVLLLREIWDRLAGRSGQPAMTDQERIEMRRRMFDPNPQVHFSFEDTNKIRDIYGLQPYTYEEWINGESKEAPE